MIPLSRTITIKARNPCPEKHGHENVRTFTDIKFGENVLYLCRIRKESI
jgi:hypothetical protein